MDKNRMLTELAKHEGLIKQSVKKINVKADVDDVVQNFYLRAYDKADPNAMFKDGKLNEGYMYIILRNMMYNESNRANRINTNIDVRELDIIDEGTEQYWDDEAKLDRIKEVLTEDEYEEVLAAVDRKLAERHGSKGQAKKDGGYARSVRRSKKNIDKLKELFKDEERY